MAFTEQDVKMLSLVLNSSHAVDLITITQLGPTGSSLTQEESFTVTADKHEQIKDEIGDILIYLTNLADKCDIDPLQAAYDKIGKNTVKYPVEKVKGKNIKYDEYD